MLRTARTRLAFQRAFLEGLGSLLNLRGARPPARSVSDLDALASDWQVVGGDIQDAIDRARIEHQLSATDEHATV